MPSNDEYTPDEPPRAEVEQYAGPTVLEFGNNWCGYCRRAQPLIAEAFAAYPEMRHLRIADGPGRPLGRSFRVKLWPTLIFMREGREVARLVRPGMTEEIQRALERVSGPA